jgi:hypothetical protein
MKSRLVLFCGLLAVAFLVSVSAAKADPINLVNTRPVAVGPPASGEASLQSILDGIFGAGVVNAATNQQAVGMWGVASNPPVISPTLVVEWAGNAGSNTFGIWSGTDTSSLTLVPIFLPAAQGSTAQGVATLFWSGGLLSVGAPFGSCGTTINCVSNVAGISPNYFGFYITGPGGTWFTVDQLNGAAGAQAIAYMSPTATDTFAIAFEDLANGDNDYNDMVVRIESITPVPEPGTLALFGTGLIGIAGLVRRKLAS